MTVKQALERLRMRCSRSEHSSGQAEKLLRRWIATSSGQSTAGAEYDAHRLKEGSGKGPEKEKVKEKRPPAKMPQTEMPDEKVPQIKPGIKPEIKPQKELLKEEEGKRSGLNEIKRQGENGKEQEGKSAKLPGRVQPPDAGTGADAGENLKGNKPLSENDIPEILRSLKENKFIDDRRFAAAYVRDKLRFNGWGRNKISYMLRSLGVEEEIIREALLENYRGRDAENGCGAEQVLRKLVCSKWNSLKKEEPLQTKKIKVLRFAVGRGFEYSQVLEILQEMAKREQGGWEEEGNE